MALVVLLKGVNVGGHRRFRPSVLAKQLRRLDVVNVGAAGTLVIRKPVSRRALCAAVRRRLPFAADVMICSARDILHLTAADPFARRTVAPGIVRFVSVMAKRGRSPRLPLNIPSVGAWSVRVLVHRNRFVCGLYRRHMKAIGYLGQLEKIFGAPLTTRQWSTIQAIARILTDET